MTRGKKQFDKLMTKSIRFSSSESRLRKRDPRLGRWSQCMRILSNSNMAMTTTWSLRRISTRSPCLKSPHSRSSHLLRTRSTSSRPIRTTKLPGRIRRARNHRKARNRSLHGQRLKRCRKRRKRRRSMSWLNLPTTSTTNNTWRTKKLDRLSPS